MASLAQPDHIPDLHKPIFHVAPPSGWGETTCIWRRLRVHKPATTHKQRLPLPFWAANDPNGPLLWRGRYHLFYQHVTAAVQWGWGLCWGHASSRDMVTWQHHPPAICPTPGGPDADGCFSGCAVVLPAPPAAAPLATTDHTTDTAGNSGSPGTGRHGSSSSSQGMEGHAGDAVASGVPVLLYTGVVRRPDAPPGLRPSSLAVSELCYEQQLAAMAADPGDPFLLEWVKCERQVLQETSPGLCLDYFRACGHDPPARKCFQYLGTTLPLPAGRSDPFILERPSPSNSNRWRVMLGAGIREPGTGLACACAPPAGPPSPDSSLAAGSSQQGCAGASAEAGAAGAGGDARRAARGAALVYSSDNLLTGWQYEGPLCVARSPELDGPVWECPLLVGLQPLPTPPTTAGQCTATTATAPHSAATADTEPQDSTAATAAEPDSHAAMTGHSAPNPHDQPHAPTHMLSVSVGSFPSLYYLGQYSAGRFDLGAAAGPYPLDLGDILYAPNTLDDKQGRSILWAWLRELPHPAAHTQQHAGSMCLPRVVSLGPGGVLHQQPLPLLQQLATQPCWDEDRRVLGPREVRHVAADVPASSFSLSLTLAPSHSGGGGGGAAAAAVGGGPAVVAGFMLPAWRHTATAAAAGAPGSSGSNSSSGPAAAAAVDGGGGGGADGVTASESCGGQGLLLVYDFSSCHLSVTVGPGVGQQLLTAAVQATGDPSKATGSALLAGYTGSSSSAGSSSSSGSDAGSAVSGSVRRLGGKLRLAPGEALELQVYVDGSLCEVFTGDGQVLSTRVYRGTSGSSSSSSSDSSRSGSSAILGQGAAAGAAVPGGVWLLADGRVEVQGARMAAMRSIWGDGGCGAA